MKRKKIVAPGESNLDLVTSYRWGWYGLSAIVPFAGIFIALFLYDQESREVRRVGRNCLLTGFTIWIVLPLIVVSCLLVLGTLFALSWVAEMLPGTD
jgi:hypothetical protein